MQYCGPDLRERAKWRLLASKSFQQGIERVKKTSTTSRHPLEVAHEDLPSDRHSESDSEELSVQSSATNSSSDSRLEDLGDVTHSDVPSSVDNLSSPSSVCAEEDNLEVKRKRKLKDESRANEARVKRPRVKDDQVTAAARSDSTVQGAASLFITSLAASTMSTRHKVANPARRRHKVSMLQFGCWILVRIGIAVGSDLA